MPLTPPGLVAPIAAALAGTAHIGVQVPKLALGVAMGTVLWAQAAQVVIVGAGAAGAGTVSFPAIVPAPALIPTVLAGFASQGLAGIRSPLLATALATGVSTGITSQSLILAAFPGVGSGVGVAKILGDATGPMVAGFLTAGLTGTQNMKLAAAVGIGMNSCFAALSIPVPIVGPSGPSPGSGTIVGKIV
jgi:hypothetical protein